MKAAQLTEPSNVVHLPIDLKPPNTSTRLPQRFHIQAFVNPRTGSKSWRVTGTRRNGDRVRENFSELKPAQCRQVELEAEWLARESDSTLRSTRLTEDQVGIAEACFRLVEKDDDLKVAVKYWLRHGRQRIQEEGPRLDEAFDKFKSWLETTREMRHLTKLANRAKASAFVNSTPNMPVAEVTRETVKKFLDRIEGTQRTRINYKFAISRFFAWCMEQEGPWIAANPCHGIKITPDDVAPPAVLPVETCRRLMREAEDFEGGALVTYMVVTLFAGLRPFEARRLPWEQVNLEDGELRIEKHQTKTRRSRSFDLDRTTLSWLKAYQGRPFFPSNFQNLFPRFIARIGFGTRTEEHPNLKPWPKDVLRHTAISHYFRLTGSYGRTAERFGNSERVIKDHYQGRVSTRETTAFYGIMPTAK